MKTNKILLGLIMMISLTGCWLGVDKADFKPVYYVVNQSSQNVDLVYTLRQDIAEQGFKQTDTIEINVCDTATIELLGRLEIESECRPSFVFSNIKFVSKSGKVVKEISSINNKEWIGSPIEKGEYAGKFTYGWRYEFKEE